MTSLVTAAVLRVAAALLASANPVSGTGECPAPQAVGALLPALSSAVQVDVAAVEGGARVRLLDREGRILDEETLRGADCQTLATAAADRVRRWAEARGALRAGRGLPPPPLVELPAGEEVEVPEPQEAAAPPRPWPALFPNLPVSLGLGAGIGGQADALGGALLVALWGSLGPKDSPFSGELGVTLSGQRAALFDRGTYIGWGRSTYSLGVAYRLPVEWRVDAMAGLLGSQVRADISAGFQYYTFSSFDGGLYGGGRIRIPVGPMYLWVGGVGSAWFVEHRILVGDPETGEQTSIPVLALCGFVGVAFGGTP